MEKTGLFFSQNTKQEFIDQICAVVGQSAASSFDKYLGVPALVRRSKKKTFSAI
jgi:hypothetical protein